MCAQRSKEPHFEYYERKGERLIKMSNDTSPSVLPRAGVNINRAGGNYPVP